MVLRPAQGPAARRPEGQATRGREQDLGTASDAAGHIGREAVMAETVSSGG